MTTQNDILIVGAGAAGLSCAEKLYRSGQKSVAILEARSRIGGRILTRKTKFDVLELGAEFIHGAPRFTLDLLEKCGIPFLDVTNSHFHIQKGIFKEYDFAAILERFAKRLNPQRDLTIAQFLDLQTDLSSEDLRMMKSFISGLHAADINVMGEKAWAESGAANEGSLNGVDMFRLPMGYSHLFQNLFPTEVPVHKNVVIKKIRWKPGAVEVFDQQDNLWRAKRLVITVPVGVLKSGSIRIDPAPEGFATALSELRMGHVQRLVFRFRSRFWERLSPHPIGFLQSTELDFPVWWTPSPLRMPTLTAWQGGPRAEEMSSWPLKRRAQTALKTLSEMGGFSVAEVTAQCKEVWCHNWSRDPFSLGAYSYVAQGGSESWRRLQDSFSETLHFAGEALASGSERGTVHGAFHSGALVADRILRQAWAPLLSNSGINRPIYF